MPLKGFAASQKRKAQYGEWGELHHSQERNFGAFIFQYSVMKFSQIVKILFSFQKEGSYHEHLALSVPRRLAPPRR